MSTQAEKLIAFLACKGHGQSLGALLVLRPAQADGGAVYAECAKTGISEFESQKVITFFSYGRDYKSSEGSNFVLKCVITVLLLEVSFQRLTA